jgi:hypothetical protein
VRNYTAFGLFILAVIMPCSNSQAYLFEIHPGVHAAYEYTDNYFGSSVNQRSDSIYEVGPRIGLRLATPTTNATLDGFVTKSFHNRVRRDDTTEASLASAATISGLRQTLELTYAYLQTTRRATLAEPPGLSKTHSAGASYTRELTSFTTVSLGYDYTDYKPDLDEDELTQAARIRLTHLLTPRNSIDLTYEYDYYQYEITPNANVSNAGLAWNYTVTPRLVLGLSSNYRKQNRTDLPDEDIYDVMSNGTYSLTQYTRFSASVGESWLVTEHNDRQNIYSLSASVEYAFAQDRVAVSVSKGYSAEFTSNLYGIYDTKRASLALQKGILSTLIGIINLDIVRTIPAFDTTGIIIPVLISRTEEETDIVARATLEWTPVRYITARAIYEHLQHDFEITDTERENRYRMEVEVQY